MQKTILRGLAAATTIVLSGALALGTATSAQAVPETWGITSLTLDNGIVINSSGTSGDDGGFIATMQDTFMLNMASAYTYDSATLDPIATNDAGSNEAYISQVSDLKSAIAYQLEVDTGTDLLTDMTELDQDGNLTTNVISLSSSVDLSNDNVYLMSGFGFVALWNYTLATLTIIDPDGTVTVLTGTNAATDFSPQPADHSEDSDYFQAEGVVEFDGTDYWFVTMDGNNDVSRFNITGNTDQEVLATNVDDWSDSDTLNVSTCSDKWYTHTENNMGHTSYFGEDVDGNDEPVLAFDATFSSASSCGAAPDPVLPDTGISANEGVWAAAAGLLAGIGIAGFAIARRRKATAE